MGFAYIDRCKTSALAHCSDAILRRQLAAGQHTLRLEDAAGLAALVGLPVRQVRRGYGDRQAGARP